MFKNARYLYKNIAEVYNVNPITANANYIRIDAQRIRKQGKHIHGFIYFTATKAVTGQANLIYVEFEVPSTIYVPVYNLTDGNVGHGMLETSRYFKNGSNLPAGKVFLLQIDLILP